MFRMSGCVNPDVWTWDEQDQTLTWWKSQTDSYTFTDMFNYCNNVKEGNAETWARDLCCGDGNACVPKNCREWSEWQPYGKGGTDIIDVSDQNSLNASGFTLDFEYMSGTNICTCVNGDPADHCTTSNHHTEWCYIDSMTTCADAVQGTGGPWSELACSNPSLPTNVIDNCHAEKSFVGYSSPGELARGRGSSTLTAPPLSGTGEIPLDTTRYSVRSAFRIHSLSH